MIAQNNTPKTAVLICNTGSPAAPTKEAVAKYLAEFLGDRRVVEMNPLIWQPILRGIIIPRRAQASADRYKTVWTQKGSPLVAATSDTAQGLQKVLGDEFIVSWAMCYGVQRIDEASSPRSPTQTTEAVVDAVRRVQKKVRDLPGVVTISHYFEEDAYIEALAARVRAHWEKVGDLGDEGKLMMSFHSIPAVSSERGDPYEAQCKQTAEKLRLALGLKKDQVVQVFQSKFGKAKWLEPFAIDTAPELGRQIATELRSIYEKAGGSGFHYIECLNAQDDAVALYAEIIRKALSKA